MFTGLIDQIAEVLSIEKVSDLMRLSLTCHYNDLVVGESIAVDGVCLTVVAYTAAKFTVEVSQATLAVTTLSSLQPGRLVNIERALRFSDRLGGHLVSGHVDCIGCVLDKRVEAGGVWLRIGSFSGLTLRHLVPKGSVAINGVSLTLQNIGKDFIETFLIPKTLEKTNLTCLTSGDSVNIELDMLSKLVASHLTQLTMTGRHHE